MAKLRDHAAARIFPLLDGREFDDLVEDIRRHGQIEPIILLDGRVLDGRNRARACAKLGVEPKTVDWRPTNGQTPLDFCISTNLKRRHLSASQRAMVAADALPMYEREAKRRQRDHGKTAPGKRSQNTPGKNATSVSGNGLARDQVAQAFGVSARMVQDAKYLAGADPEIARDVRAGKVALGKARAAAKRAESRAETIKRAANFRDDDIQIVHGDFREVMAEMPDGSVDLIFTDPPYLTEHIPIYGDLGRMAAAKLKSGGSLLAYVGQWSLIRSGVLLGEHLNYHWTNSLKFGGQNTRMRSHRVFVSWKPILWFAKGRPREHSYVVDSTKSQQPDKLLHPWQQDIETPTYYIEKLCPPDGLVVDPFCGSGTTLVACRQLGRRAIGIEIDAETVEVARGRLANVETKIDASSVETVA